MVDFREDINKALDCLHNGGILIYPTDTIWGIGCDATNAEAVQRIYDIKQREDSKSMLVLLDSDVRLQNYVADIPEVAFDLIELSEKPITVIYDGAKNLAGNLISADGSVGIRISNEAFSKQLIQRFKKPIVSTSANISGQASPKIFDDINQDILDQVDYVVKYRQDDITPSQASGIIKLKQNGEVSIIRA